MCITAGAEVIRHITYPRVIHRYLTTRGPHVSRNGLLHLLEVCVNALGDSKANMHRTGPGPIKSFGHSNPSGRRLDQWFDPNPFDSSATTVADVDLDDHRTIVRESFRLQRFWFTVDSANGFASASTPSGCQFRRRW